jgi:AcrR family transcriptional regulator
LKQQRQYIRETADQRRKALIQSTLMLLADGGAEAATVRNIAHSAGVTQGLIRHYFTSKEELLIAAYEKHMETLSEPSYAQLNQNYDRAHARLVVFLVAALTPPVVDAKALTLWAGFIHMAQNDPSIRAMHKKTYLQYRGQLQELIRDAWIEIGKAPNAIELRHAAIASNAILDGLWLEGGALPEVFESGELIKIGLASIGAILSLDLTEMETT